MSGKDCGGTNDSLKDHLTKCCGLGQRPDPIAKCPAGTTSTAEKPCIGSSATPCVCPKSPDCPPKPDIKCTVDPTITFCCPASPAPIDPCPPPPKKEEPKKC